LEKLLEVQGIEFAGKQFKPEVLLQDILAKTPGNTWEKTMLNDLSMTPEEKLAIEQKAEAARLQKEADQKAEQDAMSIELGALMGTSGELTRGTSHGSAKSAESFTSAASGESTASKSKKPKKKRAKKNGNGTRCSDCVIKDMEKEVMIKDLAAHIATIAALEKDNAVLEKDNADIRELNASCTRAYTEVLEENEQLREELERLKQADAVTSQMDDMGMDSTGMDSTGMDSTADVDESGYESDE